MLQNQTDISQLLQAMDSNPPLVEQLGEAVDIKRLHGRWQSLVFVRILHLLQIIAVLVTLRCELKLMKISDAIVPVLSCLVSEQWAQA